MTKLPIPERWVVSSMTLNELGEDIERQIDFVDEKGESVHPPMHIVSHLRTRHDDDLGRIVTVATLPIILADGNVLAFENDFDDHRGIKFVIPKEVMKILPRREDITPAMIKEAMEFLTDDWLCDVKADYVGKATSIAIGLTIIERTLLPDRPVFFVTSGRRGSGKTTALSMMIVGATGIRPSASAWSSDENERRKALLAYFMCGADYLLWDNIPKGAQLSCPHIERSCTTAFYSDRVLGVSETIQTAATTIHLFNGNNIGPRGDLASRALMVRIDADRPDPENREFKHPDPIAWTENHRAEILAAFYTILLGNPKLDEPHDAPMKTRFKMWWRLVGSAIEHAAAQVGQTVDFQSLFLAQDEDNEDDVSLAEVLAALYYEFEENAFKAKDVARFLDEAHPTGSLKAETQEKLREFFCPGSSFDEYAGSSVTIGKILKSNVDAPVYSGKLKQDGGEGRWMLTLKSAKDHSAGKAL